MTIDIKGVRFGRLIAGETVTKRKSGERIIECLCDCGNTTTAQLGQLRQGRKKSCGCLGKTFAATRKRGERGRFL